MTSINSIFNANFNQVGINANRQVKQFANTINQTSVNFRGTEALAAYNYNLVNKNNDFDMKTIRPIDFSSDITNVDGHPVYNSKGELVLVEKMVGDEKYIYRIDGPDNIVEVFDKNENKIKEQVCFVNIQRDKTLVVREFQAGKKDYNSSYYISKKGGDFELTENGKQVFYPDGSQKEFMHYLQTGEYQVIERSNNKDFDGIWDRILFYDKNKNLKEIWEQSQNSRSEKTINYKNGVAYQVKEESSKTIQNNLLNDLDILSDKDLKPYPEFGFHPNAQDVDGEKTYYSNGAVETNTFIQDGKKVKYYFLPDGEIRNVFFDNIVIECDGKWGYSITEKLNNGAEKYTTYFPESRKTVVGYSDNIIDKNITYFGDKVTEYCYFNNNEGFSYEFDRNGNLKDFRETTLIDD